MGLGHVLYDNPLLRAIAGRRNDFFKLCNQCFWDADSTHYRRVQQYLHGFLGCDFDHSILLESPYTDILVLGTYRLFRLHAVGMVDSGIFGKCRFYIRPYRYCKRSAFKLKTAYFLAALLMIGVIALITWPTLHGMIQGVDMSGWLPLTAAAVTFLPYAFLALIAYAVFRK